MMGLHSLQSMAQHAAALDINLSLFGDDGALDAAARPEMMVHRAPRCLGVCAVVACSVLSTHEARRSPGELHIDEASFVNSSLECVGVAIFGELNGDAIREEGVLLLVEAVILEGVACP